MTRFEEVLRFILKWEGGYSDVAGDRGGATNYGITQREYNAYRQRQSLMVQDVRHITEFEYTEIYQKEYFKKCLADEVPLRVDILLFDTAVNMGVGAAIRLLQKALGVSVDGIFGPNTRAALTANTQTSQKTQQLLSQYVRLRVMRYHAIAEAPSQSQFLKGWLNRLRDLSVSHLNLVVAFEDSDESLIPNTKGFSVFGMEVWEPVNAENENIQDDSSSFSASSEIAKIAENVWVPEDDVEDGEEEFAVPIEGEFSLLSVFRPLGLVCHLTASKWGDAEAVRQWHKDKGWSDIGYHGLILNGYRSYPLSFNPAVDGKIEPGRPESMRGAHCLANGMNTCTLGVSCVGNPGFLTPSGAGPFAASTKSVYLTPNQASALVHWLAVKCKQYGIDPQGTFKHPVTAKPTPTISQHSDWDRNKPTFASLNMASVRAAVAQRLKS